MCTRNRNVEKQPKINTFAGVQSDPEVAKAAKRLGIKNINTEKEMRKVNKYLLKQQIKNERRDKGFRMAERQLYKEGVLKQDTTLKDLSKKERNIWRKRHKRKTGSSKGWKDAAVGALRRRSTDTTWEIDKIYEREVENTVARAQKKEEKQQEKFQKQQDKLIKAQEKALKSQQKQFLTAQQKASEEAAAQQEELIKALQDQPIYSPKQAALPEVQPPPSDYVAPPTAPAPQQVDQIAPPPPPELVQAQDNNLVVVQQQESVRSRQKRASRGTSSLSN